MFFFIPCWFLVTALVVLFGLGFAIRLYNLTKLAAR